MSRYGFTHSVETETVTRYCRYEKREIELKMKTYYGVITRDGSPTWRIPAFSIYHAKQRAVEWLDFHKPDWRDPDAYANEL